MLFRSRIAASLDRGFLDATSLAEYLVTRGLPFRTAHQVVGSLVRLCEERKLEKLGQLTLKDFNAACAQAGFKGDPCQADLFTWLGPENVVKRYQTFGNAGLTGFAAQLKVWQQRLGQTS